MAPKMIQFKSKNKKQANKQGRVSFGDDMVKRIEVISLEEQAAVWYSEKEMAMMQCSDSSTEGTKPGEPSKEELSHYYAQKHVKNLVNKCRIQLEHADGYWDPKMAKELSKMSIAASKEHNHAAVKRAKTVYKEGYNCDTTKSCSILKKMLPSKQSPMKAKSLSKPKSKPKFERELTAATEMTEATEFTDFTAYNDCVDPSRPTLMRTQGKVRLDPPMESVMVPMVASVDV